MSETESRKLESADINRVMELLPHRYPMLLIDRIKDMDGNESAIGVKNVTINDPFFEGHFPGHPVMPGVLIVEAMAQTAGALVINAMSSDASNKVVYFMAIDKAKFRKPVVPGDQLELHVSKLQNRGPVWKFRGIAKVDGQVVAEADYAAMIREMADEE
ncbi:MAG: 3-hydroxyacyl-ACP dehydratase FabZ [Alphaproteobacteria bacterium]|nr:3-hydroxyacyl-[acyl-carrier-protein] dehydratase FabZ [Rhodobiaceae bacterium]MBO6542033.1 3-hydroxyacyl-ACP dehydratase FabZ [Alphaproteobacteria bacterium]MBO6628202.1 3-hydroxyacyl-ACP dehydratase FabZ [Alphaproteobacteria bacterium]MDF1625110.1 3-hydroxyacyl-ACP dehydratase FabZ [Parvibaculaceae bacterium]|tara:strand:+ start:464 stop:940 length:477 start_codon:yes stop_codon:yes gene_type:complete